MYENKLLLKRVDLLKSIPDSFQFMHLYPLCFTKNITVITGENGVGKSTILEALAVKLGCPAEGGSKNFNFATENTHLDYTKHLRISKSSIKIEDVFFYRSETYYNLLSEMRNLDSELSFDPKINSYYGGKDLHTISHGESMRALFFNRFRAKGLYILDEPEASLSIASQIDFVERIIQLAKEGAQFIIATHSPVIMLMPDIELIQITDNNYRYVNFTDTNIYYLYKEILESKGSFLKDIISTQ